MAENSSDVNIFNGAPARFMQAMHAFSGLSGLSLPVAVEKTGDAALYTLSPFSEAGQAFLTAFTGENLLSPPFITRPAREAAIILFHAPRHDLFMFNAPHPRSRGTLSPLRATRRDLSLLAGFLSSGTAAGEDPARNAGRDFSLGKLHSAHYLYSLALERNPASQARFQLGSVLIELGLLQEAYDGLKTGRDPEALLNLAVIYRRTGNQQAARECLAAIGPGTPLEDRKQAEYAWLDLEAGKEEEAERSFQRLAVSAFDKTDALSGLGAALSRTAFKTRDKGRLAAAASALRSALVSPSPASGRVFFQLGNLYFRSGDLVQAENCYRSSAAIAPTVQAQANLALALVKNGKTAEAASVTLQVALTDLPSALRLAAEFPRENLAALFPEQKAPPAAAPSRPAETRPEQQPAPQSPQPAQPLSPLDQAGAGFAFIRPGDPARTAAGKNAASLEPAQPHISSRSVPAAAQAQGLEMETLRDFPAPQPGPAGGRDAGDDFSSRAFQLSSALEDELGRKIYFNLDGISEVEKKLRLTFIKARADQQACLEMVKNASAFLCYFLQERYKGRLLKFPDFDPWGWPMMIEQSGVKLTTYPVHRVWRLLWEEAVPEPGWLSKYADWVAGKLKTQASPPCGAAAAGAKIMSHPQRLEDAAAEHKRIMVLASSLPETARFELGRTGVIKLETAIKNNFKPDIPPTADGWRLLRCYGHILAEIMIKDFKAAWYNTDGPDGGWSMRLPWNTFIFPIGKVYKTASTRGDLGEYYEVLLGDKIRSHAGGPGTA